MTKRGIIVCILAIFLILSSINVLTDGGFFLRDVYKNEDMYEPEQKALIVHDGNYETLIIQASYEGNASQFAWVIPVPSYPELDSASTRLFSELHLLTRPENVEAISPFDLIGFGVLSKDGARFQGVNIHDRQQIGIFDTATLSSEDSNSLINWLNNNSFYIPESAHEVINSYIERNWFFVAIKVDQENEPIIQKLKEFDNEISDISSAEEILSDMILSSIRIAQPANELKKIFDFRYQEPGLDEPVYARILDNSTYEQYVNYLNDKSERIDQILYLNPDMRSASGGDYYFRAGYYDIILYSYSRKEIKFNQKLIESLQIDEEVNRDNIYHLAIPKFRDRIREDFENNVAFENSIVYQLYNDKSLKANRGFKGLDFVKEKYEEYLDSYDNPENYIKDKLKLRIHNKLFQPLGFAQDLDNGLLPPIKIVFDSYEIIYPLKISSINKGETEVLLYVFADSKTQSNGFKLEFADKINKDKIRIGDILYNLLDTDYDYYLTKLRANFDTENIKDDVYIEQANNNNSYRMKVFEGGFSGWLFSDILSILMLYGWVLILSLLPKFITNKIVKDKTSPFYFSKIKLFSYPIIFPVFLLFSLIFGPVRESIFMYIFILLYFPPIIGVMIFITCLHLLISVINKITRKN